jgi:hypothetical protein
MGGGVRPPAVLAAWGGHGSRYGDDTPHGFTADARGRLYVATDGRIEVLTGDGTFLAAWHKPADDPGRFGLGPSPSTPAAASTLRSSATTASRSSPRRERTVRGRHQGSRRAERCVGRAHRQSLHEVSHKRCRQLKNAPLG